MKKEKYYLNSIFFVVVSTIMVAISFTSNNQEIIFPEIAALGIGCFLSPNFSWKVSKSTAVLLIAICSIIGSLISMFLPVPTFIKVMFAYVICQVFMLMFKTSFAPMISAAILPIIIGNTSIIYPISAILLTFAVVLIRAMMEKNGIKEKHTEYHTKFSKRDILDWIFRSIVVTAFSYVVLNLDYKFCIAPPLLVAFTEIVNKNNKMRENPLKLITLITLCSATGAILRFLVCVKLDLGISWVAFITACVIAFLCKKMNAYIPPAGALGFLPMIIPEDQLLIYPLEILASTTLFVIIAIIYNKVFCFKKNTSQKEK